VIVHGLHFFAFFFEMALPAATVTSGLIFRRVDRLVAGHDLNFDAVAVDRDLAVRP
jgi:hypothetical protein